MRGPITLGLCALLVATILTGCAEHTLLYDEIVRSRYSPTEFGWAAGRKDLRTVIHGDPFNMGQQRFDAATIATLNRYQPMPQPTTFTAEPGENANPHYRVVLVFNDPNIVTFRLCREPLTTATQKAEDDGVLYVAAAFCLNQGELTAVKGKVGNVAGVDDPKFGDLLGQIVLALFPPFDPNDDDNDDLFLISSRR
jgi:hypothetical protein